MASSSCRLGLFILLLFVYICDSKVRLNNDAKVDYTSRSKDTHENQDLFQKSKIRGKVVQDKGGNVVRMMPRINFITIAYIFLRTLKDWS